jgi:deoxycytidylate deaminase
MKNSLRLDDLSIAMDDMILEAERVFKTGAIGCQRKCVFSRGYLILSGNQTEPGLCRYSPLMTKKNGTVILKISQESVQQTSLCTNEIGNCGCAHAEPKVVIDLAITGAMMGGDPRFALMCTYSPCTNCANIILSLPSIVQVLYRTETRHDMRGLTILMNAGITVRQI